MLSLDARWMKKEDGAGKIEGQQSNKKKCNLPAMEKAECANLELTSQNFCVQPHRDSFRGSNTRDGEKTGVGTNLLSLMPSPNHNSFPPLWVSESPRQWVVAGSEKDRTENPISNIVNINILIHQHTPTSSLVHHIDYTKNTSLAFHPVIPRHVSVTIEPRRRAQRARDGAPAHHEPSCPQGLYMGKFILVYINLLCWWFVWEGSMWH